MTPLRTLLLLALASAFGTGACRRDAEDADERARVEREMKQQTAAQVTIWLQASRDLQKAAPLTKGRGWDARADEKAIVSMKEAWQRGRLAYELVEGAVAPLFPESDTATDARYDDYLSTLGAIGDPQPFDGKGVVGMHGIERILWADQVPGEVVEFEKGLQGYRPAAFPATEEEAASFKNDLAARLVADVEKMQKDLDPLAFDIAFAFHGLVDLAGEQVEKVDRAATGQEESRYAQATLRDLRANREGCWNAYRVFQPWVQRRAGGEELDRSVVSAFERLRSAYDAVPGDAIPRPPQGWSALSPTAQDLDTPFGRMFGAVKRESDEKAEGSLRAGLSKVAALLGLPKVLLR